MKRPSDKGATDIIDHDRVVEREDILKLAGHDPEVFLGRVGWELAGSVFGPRRG